MFHLRSLPPKTSVFPIIGALTSTPSAAPSTTTAPLGKCAGASTISQQTAKNLFLWSGRSYLRKGLEAALTLAIEALWSKERILEMYLNVAEFGDNVYGIHAAGQTFFGKTPDRLSRQEAALLAGVLPSPRRLHADQPSPYLLARAQWISAHMGKLGGPRFLERLDNTRP